MGRYGKWDAACAPGFNSIAEAPYRGNSSRLQQSHCFSQYSELVALVECWNLNVPINWGFGPLFLTRGVGHPNCLVICCPIFVWIAFKNALFCFGHNLYLVLLLYTGAVWIYLHYLIGGELTREGFGKKEIKLKEQKLRLPDSCVSDLGEAAKTLDIDIIFHLKHTRLLNAHFFWSWTAKIYI